MLYFVAIAILILITIKIFGDKDPKPPKNVLEFFYSTRYLKLFFSIFLIMIALFFSAMLYAYIITDEDGKAIIAEAFSRMLYPQQTINEAWSRQSK